MNLVNQTHLDRFCNFLAENVGVHVLQDLRYVIWNRAPDYVKSILQHHLCNNRILTNARTNACD